jgi:hypothetical protein
MLFSVSATKKALTFAYDHHFLLKGMFIVKPSLSISMKGMPPFSMKR